ncbi:DUF4173 domain-containing protein [Nocardia abscessus]|uniref:DUF4153 domain-containing protein n=1 Tax=Nocardia abscessus TaxID=120957 RepID=UPI001892F18E|nr:DUF4173 domain-containing protein [Nocardia abscessus]MBF6339378.1 DUF4173 domain-containing protein [Nocardia abscessus]
MPPEPESAPAAEPSAVPAPPASSAETTRSTTDSSERPAAPAAPVPDASAGREQEAAGTAAGDSPARDDKPGTRPSGVPVIARPKWHRVACPPGVVLAALVSGLAAAILIHWDRPGIGWVLAAAIAASAVFLVDRNARENVTDTTTEASEDAKPAPERPAVVGYVWNAGRLWWATVALALLAVGAVRAAGWLFALCVLAACVAGSLAVVGRRSANGILYDTLAVGLEAVAAVPWAYAGAVRARAGKPTPGLRLGLSVAVTLALLAVFVPLLGSADAMFAALLETVTPDVEMPSMVRWVVLFVVVALGALGAMYVLAGPPPPAAAVAGGRTLRRTEWALPVGALAILFAAFVATQFVALFGGDDYVQDTSGLTYAEYARTGFWQLSAVTVLTLAVLLIVLRWAAQDTAADRWWLRGLLTAVSLLALVIVASALGRMWTYQQAYGFTVLRLLVEACELWLGLVYVLVLIAVVRLHRAWLPRAVLGTAMATLLVLAVLDPERLIADENIDRWQQGKSLDTEYLLTLSPDILPAIDRLPEPLRADVHARLRADLDEDTWQSWNLSRARAR